MVMSELNDLSRVTLLDHKRNGLPDAAIAALYDSAPRQIAALRQRLGVPALAADLSLTAPASKVRAGPERERSTKERPIGTGAAAAGTAWDDEPMRTTEETEAYFRDFFSRHPDFSADNVQVRPMRRMPTGIAGIVGRGASALYGA
jgi:hypothetical protein